MDQWQINRAGVVNFWYYDEEEFQFEEGRLLLRGANGSGKSVTMQSLVPLLFDGNKSPERLDPFGSKARRMESYLLSDGLDLDERTGYLFLEFAKPEIGRFITIGMGMKARQNMPLQSWYFIVLDNRRVGQGRELSLYKDIGDKLPLTHKELDNRIGSGGFVTTKQGEYKEKVNEHLFGYSDLGDFDELITLLIQIRSPKLSKEFKPTTIYEIMQTSLITLTEDDLRPMSEAIENMDEIKAKIDTLNQSKKAITRIEAAYSKYNHYFLAQKAKRYISWFNNVNSGAKRLTAIEQEIHEYTNKREALNQSIQKIKDEESELKRKETRLKDHDLIRLAEERIELEKTLKDLNLQMADKDKQIEKTEDEERSLRNAYKTKNEQKDVSAKEIQRLLTDMDEFSDAPVFDEHAFFADEYRKAGENAYAFDFHKNETEKYFKRLKIGCEALKVMENSQRAYEELLELKDAKSKAVEDQKRKVKDQEGLFTSVKEEFAERVFAWAGDHAILPVEKSVLSSVVERVYQYGELYRFNEVIEPLRFAYEGIRSGIQGERSEIQGRMNLEKSVLKNKIEALDALKALKEPEPERSSAVIENRKKLEKAGIPFIPLYMALDFKHDLEENIKGRIEECLHDLGILDALIVEPQHRNEVLAMDEGLADKYIFADPQLLSHNLSTYLKSEADSTMIHAALIEDIICSIFLNPSEHGVYISEDGTYGVGIITGKSSGTSSSRFIGYQSRKRYKEQLINIAILEVQESEGVIEELQRKIEILDARLNQCKMAWESFPSNTDLDTALYDLESEQRELKAQNQELTKVSTKADDQYKELKSKQLLVHEKTKDIHLPHSSVEYQTALNDMEEYRKFLNELILEDRNWRHMFETLSTLTERIEAQLDLLDTLRYEKGRISQEHQTKRVRQDHVIKELDISENQMLIDELRQCRARLEEIPEQMQGMMNEFADVGAYIENKKNEQSDHNSRLRQSERMRDLYAWAFEEEWKLGLSGLPDIEQTLFDKASNVLGVYSDILAEGKTIVELRENLNEKYLKEMGELAEYNLKSIQLFKEIPFDGDLSEDDRIHIERVDIIARMQGRQVRFYEMLALIDRQINENGSLLDEQDRELFEEILVKSVSRKISSKIYHSEKWVKKIDELMNSMDTSMGLTFNLKWVTREAQAEDQMSTKELVDILKGDQSLLTREQKNRLITHFRSKIQETRNRLGDGTDQRSFLAIMKDILDYRKWFEFQLSYTKTGDKKREVTNNAFFTFSGGEKAMAMYVPLFSAVYAKYQGGRTDCPKVISLDEAFAGVDEKNIQDMFRLLVELKLSFVANSQVLFGDYETVPALGIYELIRPENVTYVTLIRYLWNGKVRSLVMEGDDDSIMQ